MEFPKWKKTLSGLLGSAGRVFDKTKLIVLSTGLLSFVTGQAATQPDAASQQLVIPNTEIKRYSSKFLLKAPVASNFAARWAQHRSHSSHSSHRSHSSHSSHYSSSAPSHASHYSSSGPTAPPARTNPPARTTPRASETPRRTAPKLGATITFGDYVVNSKRIIAKWRQGLRSFDSIAIDETVEAIKDNSRLKITPHPRTPGQRFYGYVSETPLNLTEGIASVEVVQVTSAEAVTSFALVIDERNWYGFSVEGGKLLFESEVGGILSSAKLDYDFPSHRFWRFRHDATNNLIFWETSSNSATWNVRHAVTPQIPITALYVELNAGTSQIVNSPGAAIFDNFQVVLKH